MKVLLKMLFHEFSLENDFVNCEVA